MSHSGHHPRLDEIAARWSRWHRQQCQTHPEIADGDWTVQQPIWDHYYISGNMRLTCFVSGVFGRHPSIIALDGDGVEQWRESVPHEVGYHRPRTEGWRVMERKIKRLLEWLENQRQDYADVVTDAGEASLW